MVMISSEQVFIHFSQQGDDPFVNSQDFATVPSCKDNVTFYVLRFRGCCVVGFA
jgi:hypothetical protein